MTKKGIQHWYRAEVRVGAKITYILAAESVAKAREKLGLFAKGHLILALTWSDITKFTGCEIPEGCKADDFAHGSLAFRKGDFCWFLWLGTE